MNMNMNRVVGLSFIVVMISGCGGNAPEPTASFVSTSTHQTGAQKKVIVKNPYEVENKEKLSALTNYLINKDLSVAEPTFPQKPIQPQLPNAKELIKGKYEKTADFEARVEVEKTSRIKQIKAIEVEYARDVQVYNSEVKRLTADYNTKVALKQKDIKNITLQAMAKAYSAVYGKPYLDKALKYDPDNERFYGFVKSTKGGFSESVAINVPAQEAENFEKNLNSLNTKVVFDYADDKLILKNIVLEKDNRSYVAMLSDSSYKSENISVAINNGSLNLPVTPLLSSSLVINSTDYAIGEINYSKDPEIAKLQKQKFELERRVNKKNSSQKKEAELKKQKIALETQITLLEQKSSGADDIGILLKDVKAHTTDETKWLFIVAIENYDFTDPVAYSANSARQFEKVAQKRLGISEKNTRTLINTGATSGKIRYYMQDMLAHVKSGDTIYFYYSGHGVPVASQENTPYMLAQDMSPDYVANDEKFKLQNIYQSFSGSKASKVVAFVDSCFSGGTDNQVLFKGVAATRIKPKSVTFDTNKMVVISAGSGTQYSNKYDAKSNRLFSYFVMRGLLNNNIDTQRLYDYVKSNVQEKSYEMGASYEQVPVYTGNIGLEL